MSIVDAIGLGIRKLYTEKKAMVDFETIKKESGLKELDWNAAWESVSKYPAEVQTVLEGLIFLRPLSYTTVSLCRSYKKKKNQKKLKWIIFCMIYRTFYMGQNPTGISS